MEDFVSRIKHLREEKELSLRQLAKITGISSSALHSYEMGIRQPGRIALESLSDAFNVDINYLLGKTDIRNLAANMYGYDSLEAMVRDGVAIPTNLRPAVTKRFRMLGEIACGKPIYAEEDHSSYIDASNSIDADYCLTARGDSMIGARIQDGDVVFIKEQPIVANGEIAAVVIDNEATLKVWYFDEEAKKLVLSPANPAYQPLVFVGNELDSIICLGKAVCFMSNL